MFKSEEQINERLNSKRNLVNRFGNGNVESSPDPTPHENPYEKPYENPPEVIITPLHQPGNKLGARKLLEDERDEIATRARLGEGQKALAAEFGVSQNAVSNIERGLTKVNEQTINARIDQVQDVAMEKLLTSLGFITEAKTSVLDPVKLSVVASNMSKIVQNIQRKDENSGPKVIVQIYAPERKKESSYQTLDV